MPWSGGVYTRGYASWTNDANSNLPISATKFDTEDNDFAAGLNNCITKDGLNNPNVALTWGLSAAQILALTRASDGLIFSAARTSGSNNPSFGISTTDSTQLISFLLNGSASLTLNASTGAIQSKGATAGALVDMSPDKGSWTSTLTGPYAVGITGTLKWERQGSQVTIWCDSNITGNATSASFISASGLPAEITPSSQRDVMCYPVIDNGTSFSGIIQVLTGNTLSIFLATVSGTHLITSGFTGSGTTGVSAGWSITYSL